MKVAKSFEAFTAGNIQHLDLNEVY